MRDKVVNNVNMDILDKQRIRLGMSYKQLATKIDVAPSTLSKLFRGRDGYKWRLDRLKKVMNVLCLTPEEVIEDILFIKQNFQSLTTIENSGKRLDN